jgi:RNA polymerase-binding protein DksA
VYLVKKALASYQRQLSGIRDRLRAQVSDLGNEAFHNANDGSGNLSHVPLHMADLAADACEQTVTLALLEREEETLREIGAALARINAGTFGECEECGQRIAMERLEALPYARHCISCARQLEGNGNA